jgi:hypothetical protein
MPARNRLSSGPPLSPPVLLAIGLGRGVAAWRGCDCWGSALALLALPGRSARAGLAQCRSSRGQPLRWRG